jgi:hypothetical protein
VPYTKFIGTVATSRPDTEVHGPLASLEQRSRR